MAAATGKQASCLFKKTTTAQTALGLSLGYANEVSAGWLAFNGAACDWRLAMGEGLGVDDSWDPASQEQADREREREKKRAIEGEQGERERKTGSQTS